MQLKFKYNFYSKNWWNGDNGIISLVYIGISYKQLTQRNDGKRISGGE